MSKLGKKIIESATEALKDIEIDNIWDEAEQAAEQASITNMPVNPYNDDDWRAEVWASAFRHHMFSNGWH